MLEAPAKINLGLRITGRRADGYHELESLFVPLDLADHVTLHATAHAGVSLEVRSGGAPEGEANLAFRAASAFLAEPAARGGVAIELEKRIPSPAGLGGGSSDAAAVLRGLARLQPAVATPARLAELALALGADVPFFLDPHAAWVTGIGETIRRVDGLPELWVALAHPGKPLATADVFAAFDARDAPAASDPPGDSLTAPGPRPTIRRLLALRGRDAWNEALEGLDSAGWREFLANDLEPTAVRLCPEVAVMREEFEATQALAAGMSGSGPTVYGVFRNAEEARDAAGRVTGRTGARTWVVETAP